MKNLFAELKRRNVFKVGVAYAIVAWVVVQVGEIVLEAFGHDNWLKVLIIVVALGFPLTLLLAWIYEVTPEGVKKDKDARKMKNLPKGWKLNWVIFGALLLAVTFIIFQQVAIYNRDAWDSGPMAPWAKEQSIAVLPFLDLSENRDQEYFADGISEDILNLLAQVENLRVTSRSSSFSFKGQNVDIPTIASRLNVNHVLEGSIRRSGDRVRITAQLIEVETDSHIWSANYNRNMTDIFELQDEIASAIVEALKLSLGTEALAMPVMSKSSSIDAYDFYLLGRHSMAGRTRAELEEARRDFEEAVALDPDFAPARAALAQSIIHLSDNPIGYGDLTNEEVTALAVTELEMALELDPKLASAYGAYGLYYLTLQNFTESEKALEKAIDLNPNYAEAHTWLGIIYAGSFRYELAHQELEKSFALDPLSLLGRNTYAYHKSFLGEFEEAENIARSMVQDFPDHPFGYVSLSNTYRLQGQMAKALQFGLQALQRGATVEGAQDVVEDILADFRSIELSEKALGYVPLLVLVSAGSGEEALQKYLAEIPLDDVPFSARTELANLLIVGGDQEAAFG
ncbi:MAG: tetratricopeptide repeat protein, partial [Proteobacteria bacterium]|nr:tetratricopeptide repeat protein [Pseudomonadota bacterium]